MTLPTNVDGTWVDLNTVQLNAGELRRADAAMFAGDGSALGVLGGIVRHGTNSCLVSVDGSDVVTIKSGSVVIDGSNAVAGTGAYRFGIASDITGSLAARNATNARIDLVVARQLDDDVVTTHDAYTGQFAIITGTPSGSPAVPTLPSMAVELGRINVPNTGGGAASADLSHRSFAAAIGAEVMAPALASLPSGPAKWQVGRALDTGQRYVHNGTSWVPDGPFAMASGITSVTVSASSAGTQAMTFPVGRFTLSPILTLAVAGSQVWLPSIPSGLSAAGATLGVRNVDNTSTSTSVAVHWQAVQMTPTSAAG